MPMSLLDLFAIISIIIILIALILSTKIKIEPVKEQIDTEKDWLRPTNMSACPKCGLEYDKDAKFCGSCGSPITRQYISERVDIMYCKYCGEKIEGTENFCGRCGNKLNGDTHRYDDAVQNIESPIDSRISKKKESKKSYGTYGAIIIIVLILIAGIWLFQQVMQRDALRNVIINVDDIGIGSIGITSATLNIRLSMYNPNSVTATLDRLDYQIYGNNIYIGNGNIYQRIDIPSRQTKYVTTDFRISYGGALKTIWSAITRGNVDWRMSGTAYFDTPLGTLNIPFDQQI